jgi:hypothetical protein
LAQNEVRTEVVTKLAATRAKQELAALWVEMKPKKEEVDEDAFDEANFKLDLEEYLWDYAKLFAEMPKDKKNIFANTLTQLLKDNGKTIELDFWDWYETFDTLEEIQDLMWQYAWFLGNIDSKRQNAVPLYNMILEYFQDYREQWLVIDDTIMHTVYGMKIFAEQVDFERREIFGKPWRPSEKYAKYWEWLKDVLANLEVQLLQLDEEWSRLDEELLQIKAEIEVLKIVTKWLEAMSRVK